MSSNNTYRTRSNGGQHGDVFTKPEVVSFMLDEVSYKASDNLSSISIMEPSCGEGEFLIDIIRRLKQSSLGFDFNLNEAYHKCVFASDIDAGKIAVCANRIKSEFPEIEHPEQNLFVEDYLLSSHKPVDIIIGNPPYIRYEEIPEDKLARYKTFPTFYYRTDMYVLFFEKSLAQLNHRGRHCFICANRWMKNQYGKLLRKLVAEHYFIEKILNMEGADAFQEGVLAYPAITIISNKAKGDKLLFANISNIASLKNVEYESYNSPQGSDWSNVFNAQEHELSLIEDQNFKIGIGVATGADNIFISNDLKDKVENELLLPVINAKDLSGDKMIWGGRYFLNPYDKYGNLISLDAYPKAKAYLESHKERLAARHKARKNPYRWYGTIDSVSSTLQCSPKILLPDISGNSYVFVDEGNYYPQHNIYYITGKGIRQLRILAAILMSEFVRKQLDNLTNHMNGGYARWQSQYLRKLHIPNIEYIPSELADSLLKCYEDNNVLGINYYVARILSNEKENPLAKIVVKSKPQELTLSFEYS